MNVPIMPDKMSPSLNFEQRERDRLDLMNRNLRDQGYEIRLKVERDGPNQWQRARGISPTYMPPTLLIEIEYTNACEDAISFKMRYGDLDSMLTRIRRHGFGGQVFEYIEAILLSSVFSG